MAGRKYKPALYELVGKGPLKPDNQGSISTPKWFYPTRGKPTESEQVEPLRREVKTFPVKRLVPPTIEQPAPMEEASEQDYLPQEFTVSGESIAADAASAHIREFGLHIRDKKIVAWAPYWVLALIGLGLILTHLMLYSLGVRSGASRSAAVNDEASENTAAVGFSDPVDDRLREIREGDVRPGLMPDRTESQQNPEKAVTEPPTQYNAGSAENDAGAEIRAVENLPSTVNPVPPAEPAGFRLIICGHKYERTLRPVQSHFARNGIKARIGKYNNRYVLFTEQTVQGSKSSVARSIKSSVAKFGITYNQEKLPSAPSFNAETFTSETKGPFWVYNQKITKLDN